MAWNASRGSAHHQMKLCKDEQSDQLVLGLIPPGLPSTSQDMVPVSRKRPQQALVYPRGDFVDDDDICDELTNTTEKKRRLTIEQVKYLEMSFSMDLKLEPERKALIAKNLGLRPRQVAIWFQNRRARWKNKQLEQDYEALKAKYEATVRENENMVKRNEAIMEENKRLHAQVAQLTGMIGDRDVPGIENGMGGGPARSLPDSDSDSESGSKEEQLSAKSELASPTKSDDQSEMQDSGHSYPTSEEEAVVAFVDQPTGEISSFIACTAVKYEAEDGPLSPPDMAHNNHPLLIQQYVNSFFHGEDLFFNWEDNSYAFQGGVF